MITAEGAELKAMQRRFRALPKELKNRIRKQTRAEVNPIWREEVNGAKGATRMGATIFKSGTRVKAAETITLVAGAGTKKMSGGGTPVQLARAFEFGGRRQGQYTKYNRTSPKGRTHTVTRRTSKQLPPFKKSGYTVYPASRASSKRLAKLSAQTMVRAIYDSIER